jgi:hypothetical protein
MSIIYRTTLTPTKMELLSGWLPTQRWYLGPGGTAKPEKAGGFRLDDPDGAVGLEFMVVTDQAGSEPVTYHVPLTYRGAPLDGAVDALIGTTEHGVLGKRWVYDGTRDLVLVRQLIALLQGRAAPQAQSQTDTLDPTVLVHPATRAPLESAGFTVSDGPDGTAPRTEAGAAGKLLVSVCRVLTDDIPSERSEPSEQEGRGYVTAPWRRPDGTTARSVLATATLH